MIACLDKEVAITICSPFWLRHVLPGFLFLVISGWRSFFSGWTATIVQLFRSVYRVASFALNWCWFSNSSLLKPSSKKNRKTLFTSIIVTVCAKRFTDAIFLTSCYTTQGSNRANLRHPYSRCTVWWQKAAELVHTFSCYHVLKQCHKALHHNTLTK